MCDIIQLVMNRAAKAILKGIYKPRPKNAKKYDFGLMIVIGGSEFYSGPPALSALAAFRSGVDMVHIIAPKRAADIIATFSPNLAAYPLNGERIGKKDLAILLSLSEADELNSRGNISVVIGGGLGRTEETQSTIREYISNISIPAVIDADAIHAISINSGIIKNKGFLVTPHEYEFFILTGEKIAGKSEKQKAEIVKKAAHRLKTTILLKGNADIISDGEKVVISKTGNPYLTNGGTGDTLAGIAGAIMARGENPFISAQAAAYINGKAGEIASKKKRDGLLATDLIEMIPKAIFGS